jgi:hypothetical protein
MPRWQTLTNRALHHFQLRCQYITQDGLVGTLMSHYFFLPLSLSLAVALLPAGMLDASCVGTLVFLGSSALAGQARLFTARLGAITLSAVAHPAHQYAGVTARTYQRACTLQVPNRHSQIPLESRMRGA